MGVYCDEGETGGLYAAGAPESNQAQPDGAAAAAGVDTSASASASASNALIQTAELVAAGPGALLADVLPADPTKSSLPLGLAIIGLCAVGVLWAASIDGGRK